MQFSSDLITLVNNFPDREEEILSHVFTYTEFVLLTYPSTDLCQLAICFPEHAYKFFDQALYNSNKFKKIIVYSSCLVNICKQFLLKAQPVLDCVLFNIHKFKNLILDGNDLVRLANAFPTHSENFFNHALRTPDSIISIINSEIVLEILTAHFTQHAYLFQDKTIEQAQAGCLEYRNKSSREELIKNTQFFSLWSACNRMPLPLEIQEKIVVASRNRFVHRSKQALVLFQDEYKCSKEMFENILPNLNLVKHFASYVKSD